MLGDDDVFSAYTNGKVEVANNNNIVVIKRINKDNCWNVIIDKSLFLVVVGESVGLVDDGWTNGTVRRNWACACI